MSAIELFIDEAKEPARSAMIYLHDLLTTEMGLTAKMRYRIPFYDGRTWICYLNPQKDQRVELAFLRGSELSNVQGMLSLRGRKRVSGVIFSSLEEIPHESLVEVLLEAIELDATSPYTFTKKKKP